MYAIWFKGLPNVIPTTPGWVLATSPLPQLSVIRSLDLRLDKLQHSIHWNRVILFDEREKAEKWLEIWEEVTRWPADAYDILEYKEA